MAFKNKNKTRNESNYKITIDQLHKTMSQNFIEEFKSLKSLNEEKNDLEIEINEIKKTINDDLIPNFEKQNKLWNLEERLEELDKKILDIENNNMEKNYLLKSGKLLNNYYKLLRNEKLISKNSSDMDFDINNKQKNSNIKSNDKLKKNKTKINNNNAENNNAENNNAENNNAENNNTKNSIKEKNNIKNNNKITNLQEQINQINNEQPKKKIKKDVLDWLNYDMTTIRNDSNNMNNKNIDDSINNLTNNLNKLSKKKIYDDYMKVVDSNYISVNNNDNDDELFDICINCKSEMALNHNTGMLNCKGCGMTEKIIIDSDKQSHKDPPKEMTSFSYKRINHLTEILSQFQAKETTEIPEFIYDKILIELKKERINNMCSLTTDKLRSILKKINETDYYEHMPYIINQLNGLPPPIISPEVEEIIKSLFLQTQYPFNKYCPDDRKNFLTYGYTLYKLFELLELDEYLINFKFLKNRKKLYAQEQVWKKICNELKWEFIPSL